MITQFIGGTEGGSNLNAFKDSAIFPKTFLERYVAVEYSGYAMKNKEVTWEFVTVHQDPTIDLEKDPLIAFIYKGQWTDNVGYPKFAASGPLGRAAYKEFRHKDIYVDDLNQATAQLTAGTNPTLTQKN
ncbi:hypothetical protein D3X11_04590 [Streptococcus sp. X16XC17]|uniref:hypothetical protein n=1 Tax=unclassified Streptococcus TaxID=2608887 RepID=UPI00066FF5EF|nr:MULTISPECIES: hypothetical protein [unclassified Streptococcus]TCD46656.1 hypothetical protein D3X11_04590 [Streptococcus sp. X16XC17]